MVSIEMLLYYCTIKSYNFEHALITYSFVIQQMLGFFPKHVALVMQDAGHSAVRHLAQVYRLAVDMGSYTVGLELFLVYITRLLKSLDANLLLGSFVHPYN